MTCAVFSRGRGTRLTCNACGEFVVTALAGSGAKKRTRAWFARAGWGRGVFRGRKTTSKSPGSPSTKRHDLCPTCRPIDVGRAIELERQRMESLTARDARRKARDLAIARGEPLPRRRRTRSA